MPDYIYILLVLAVITTLGYFRGRKKNRWISGWIGRESEAALHPGETKYTNIGGTIGYNFTYTLSSPLKEAKGTFTLLPRQSLLYLPFSMIIARYDRYYLHLYASKKLLGEAHVVREDYFSRMRTSIAGIESLNREVLVHKNRRYILVSDSPKTAEPAKKFLASLENSDTLLHFCAYAETKVFFVYMKPRQGEVERVLKTVMKAVPSFLVQKGT